MLVIIFHLRTAKVPCTHSKRDLHLIYKNQIFAFRQVRPHKQICTLRQPTSWGLSPLLPPVTYNFTQLLHRCLPFLIMEGYTEQPVSYSTDITCHFTFRTETKGQTEGRLAQVNLTTTKNMFLFSFKWNRYYKELIVQY